MSRYQAQHTNPSGPGDSRPTALQIIKDEDLIGELTGKVIFITGANQGLGLESARALYETGATIYMGVRDLAKGQKAIDDILSTASKPDPKSLHLIEMSLDSLDSVRAGGKAFLAQSSRLDILLLNAGVMATPEGRTKDGFETQFGINHVGHFLLFELLQSALLASSTPAFNSRVVLLSSLAHRFNGVRLHDLNFDEEGSYDPMVSYGQAKTANLLMANEIERRYGTQGLHGLAVHPGIVGTNLSQYLDPSVMKAMAEDKESFKLIKDIGQGASTSVLAAVGREWEGRGACYLADCAEQGPAKPDASPWEMSDQGYAPWAFDEENAKKLWDVSVKLVEKWNAA
ncbi:putative ww domain-containing oxidoreductase protein [Ilyonectria robusta]